MAGPVATFLTKTFGSAAAQAAFTATKAIPLWASVTAHVITAGATMIGSALLAPKNRFGQGSDRNSLTVRGANSLGSTTNRQYIYGEVKVGGTIVYMGTSDFDSSVTGNDNRYLHMALVHCDHETEELGDLYVNGEVVNFSAYSSDGALRSATGTRYSGSLSIADHHGGPSQTVNSTLDAAMGNWYASDKLSGMSYTYIRLLLKDGDDNAFPTGIPQFQRVVKGRKVYDPRESSHDPDDSTTWEYSSNWALCVADYLQSEFGYGRIGLGHSKINETELIASANNSDETVNSKWDNWSASEDVALNTQRLITEGAILVCTTAGTTGTSEPAGPYSGGETNISDGTAIWRVLYANPAGTESRYELNGIVNSDEDPMEVVRSMRTAADGLVEYIGGEWFVRSGRYITPTITLDESDFAGPISGTTKDDRTVSVNTIKGVIVNKDDAYNVIDVPSFTNSTFVTEDNGVVSTRELELLFTNSPASAQRLFKIALAKARQQISHKATFTAKAMQLQVGDNFKLDFAKYAYSSTASTPTTFQVWSHQLKIGGNGELLVDMEFREIASNTYDFDATTDQTTVDPAPTSFLPDPFTVTAPTGMSASSGTDQLVETSDGSILPTVLVEWTAAASVNVIGYQIRWKYANLVRDAHYRYLTINGRNNTSLVITGVRESRGNANQYIDIDIRSITPLKEGEWTVVEDGHDVIGKSEAPTDPSSPTVAAVENGVTVTFSEHPDLDFLNYHIWVQTSASAPTHTGTGPFTPIATTTTSGLTKTILGLDPSTTYYVFTAAMDSSRLFSDIVATTPATISPSAIAAGDIENLGFLATEDSINLGTEGNGGVTTGTILPVGNTEATDNGTTIDTSGNIDSEINLNTNGAVAVGKTSSSSTTSGFWLGTDGSGDYDFHIGNTAKSLQWDGSVGNLSITGDVDINVDNAFSVSEKILATGNTSYNTWQGPPISGAGLFSQSPEGSDSSMGLLNVGAAANTDIDLFAAFTDGTYASKTAVGGERHFDIEAFGYDGSNYKRGGTIQIKILGPVSSSHTYARSDIGIFPKSTAGGGDSYLFTPSGLVFKRSAGLYEATLRNDGANDRLTAENFRVAYDLTIGGALYDGQSTPSSGTSGQVLSSTGSGTQWIDSAAGLWTQSGSDIYYDTGRVGIGAAPTAPLQVQADAIAIKLDGSSNTTRSIFFRNTTSSNPAQIFSDGSLRLFTEDSGTDIRFHTNSNGSTNERLRINSTGIDVTGNVSLADNGKATFGSGDDLQIYHDGSHARLRETTGDFRIQTTSSGVNALVAKQNAQVEITHAGSTKLATTSTGIDVTGTAKADGLTVEASISSTVSSATGTVGRFINNANSSDAAIVDIVGGNTSATSGEAISALYLSDANANGRGRVEYSHQNDSLELYSAAVPRLNIANNGDISFYEDTGTTAKLFWDASAEGLGIGTSSLTTGANLTLSGQGFGTVGADSGSIAFGQNASYQGRIYQDNATSDFFIENTYSSGDIAVKTNGSERLRIDSSGNVGIGTTSPSSPLTLNKDTGTTSAYSTASIARIDGGAGSNEIGGIGFGYYNSDYNGYKPHAFVGSVIESWTNYSKAGLVFATRGVDTNTEPTERLRIDSSGNVGIGTPSPSSQLTIRNTTTQLAPVVTLLNESFAGNEGGAIDFDYSQTQPTAARISTENDGAFSADLLFSTKTTGATGNSLQERMRIDSSGDVGIGTASPDHKLSVFGDSSGNRTEIGIDNIDQRLVLGAYFETGVTQYSTIQATNNAESSGTNLVLQPDGGNVGIGATPNDKLHVQGVAKITTAVLTPLVKSGNASGGVVLQGGNSGGANIELYGESHASVANDAYYDADVHNFRSASAATAYATFAYAEIDFTRNLNMNNYNITGVNALHINDPGVNEGIQWSNGNGWGICEAPDNLSNAAGNLQFTDSGNRRMTITTSGDVDIPVGNLYVGRPADAWTTSSTWLSMFGGEINTGGSYAVTINSNGYRNTSNTWTSLGINNYTGASQIWAYPTGVITLNTSSSHATGASTVVNERLRVAANGQVSIGTTSGGYKLRVAGNGFFDDQLTLGSNGSEGGEIRLLDSSSSTSQAAYLDVDAANNARFFQIGNGDMKLGNLTGGTGNTKIYCNADLKIDVKSTQTEITDQLYVSGYAGSDSIVTINGIDCGGGMLVQGSLDVDVDLEVSGNKNFRIAHPVREGHDLRHTCVESPQADLTYRGKATLVDGTVQLDLDSEFGMTSGTFAALNDDVQVFVQNDSGWDAVRGSVSDGVLTITCYNLDSHDSVGWLVIGRRTGVEIEIEPETKIK